MSPGTSGGDIGRVRVLGIILGDILVDMAFSIFMWPVEFAKDYCLRTR